MASMRTSYVTQERSPREGMHAAQIRPFFEGGTSRKFLWSVAPKSLNTLLALGKTRIFFHCLEESSRDFLHQPSAEDRAGCKKSGGDRGVESSGNGLDLERPSMNEDSELEPCSHAHLKMADRF